MLGLHVEALPTAQRAPLLGLALASAVAVALIGSYYSGTATAGQLDAWILATLDVHLPNARPIGLAIDWCGEPAGAVTLSSLLAAACLLARTWRLAILTVASQCVIGGATGLLKPIFERTIHGGFLSYPSGHTAGATALAIVLGLMLAHLVRADRARGLLIVLGTTGTVGMIAASAQTLLVAHYATDTIGGFLMALALIPPTAALLDWTFDGLGYRRATSTPI